MLFGKSSTKKCWTEIFMQMHYASEVHSVSAYLPSQHGYPTGWQRGVSYHARITPIFWKLSRITGK